MVHKGEHNQLLLDDMLWAFENGISWRGICIENRTREALERAYLSLQRIIANLYAEADDAVAAGDYNDASLLQSQADMLYQAAENLGSIIVEQEEWTI